MDTKLMNIQMSTLTLYLWPNLQTHLKHFKQNKRAVAVIFTGQHFTPDFRRHTVICWLWLSLPSRHTPWTLQSAVLISLFLETKAFRYPKRRSYNLFRVSSTRRTETTDSETFLPVARCWELDFGMTRLSSAPLSRTELGFLPKTFSLIRFRTRTKLRRRVSLSSSPPRGSKWWRCLLWLWLSVTRTGLWCRWRLYRYRSLTVGADRLLVLFRWFCCSYIFLAVWYMSFNSGWSKILRIYDI